MAIMLLGLAPMAAQTSKAAGAKKNAAVGTWTPPLAPDGKPELHGVWVSNSATPLERPKALEGKQSLTDAEVAELRNRADRIFKSGMSDFAAGDNAFLAALSDVDRYKNPIISTSSSVDMIDRVFDNRTSLIIDPPDGRLPPLTAAGRQRQAAADAAAQHPARPEDLNNALRCITWGVPRLGGNFGAGPYSYYQIVQTPKYLVLLMEMAHEARVIPLDARPHLPQNVRQWSGDSRGRWEQQTLVVDTTNFSAKSYYMGSAENLHLVERFTRIAPDTIHYQITVDDLTTWTKPWTAVILLKLSAEKIYEAACHEGNEPMFGVLSAARAQEKAAGAAPTKGPK
jgi:hypothetical protein